MSLSFPVFLPFIMFPYSGTNYVLCGEFEDDQELEKNTLPYLYNFKTMAEDMGFEDWEKCTGHGIKKMGISTAMTCGYKNIAPLVLGMSRHKHYQTSLTYQKVSDEMYKNYNKAMTGKHVASPPKRAAPKRKKCTEMEEYVSSVNNDSSTPDARSHDMDTTLDSSIQNAIINNPNVEASSSVVTPAYLGPTEIELYKETHSTTGNISSVTSGHREKECTSGGYEMGIMPYSMMGRSSGIVTPRYSLMTQPIYNNTQSNNVQKNIIMHPPLRTLTDYQMQNK